MELIKQEVYSAMALHNFALALVLVVEQQQEEE